MEVDVVSPDAFLFHEWHSSVLQARTYGEVGRLQVTFFGVRGSCPCSGPQYSHYGGNTSCVAVDTGSGTPIVLDLGTGLRPLGVDLERRYGQGTPLALTGFVTHLHWDHIIGLPFCSPLLRFGGSMRVYGPPQDHATLHEVIDRVVIPPFFPVQVKQLHGVIEFDEIADNEIEVGEALVKSRLVPHVGPTLGFRIEHDGKSVAFISDHQQPDDREHIDKAVLELCEDADLMIHDAQFTDAEFEAKSDWGHCTFSYAVQVAIASGAKNLVLYHHDPLHSDADIEAIVKEASCVDGAPTITAAAEGMTIDV